LILFESTTTPLRIALRSSAALFSPHFLRPLSWDPFCISALRPAFKRCLQGWLDMISLWPGCISQRQHFVLAFVCGLGLSTTQHLGGFCCLSTMVSFLPLHMLWNGTAYARFLIPSCMLCYHIFFGGSSSYGREGNAWKEVNGRWKLWSCCLGDDWTGWDRRILGKELDELIQRDLDCWRPSIVC